MIDRFQNEKEGRRRLIDALKGNRLVEHDEVFASKLADKGDLVTFVAGDTIIEQGQSDNDVYFLLSGEADVFVNLRWVATRRPQEPIGEMAALEPTAPRSATVKARSELVALKVSEATFQDVAKDHPGVWKAVGRIVAERLRQRAVFLNAPHQRPVLFLGSSVESLPIAEEITFGLKHSKIDVAMWTTGIFGPSSVTLDALIHAVDEADFAAFVFAPEDKVISRDREQDAPRDNVVFELGLFMGRLDRNRTFIVKEHSTDIKIPSDLIGINPITYVYDHARDLSACLSPVCMELRKTIQSLGVK